MFSFQVRGDRLYLDGDLRLKLRVVEMLKGMGSNYPENSSDFDEIFLYRSMKSIFTKIQLRKFAKSQSLFDLEQPKRKFLKGNFNILNFDRLSCEIVRSSLDIFAERITSDAKRMNGFRSKAISAAKKICSSTGFPAGSK